MSRGSKRRPSKTELQRRHFRARMFERYGIVVNHTLYQQLCARVRHGEARLVRKTSNRVSVLMLRVEDKAIPVVYDYQRGTLVTALPQRD